MARYAATHRLWPCSNNAYRNSVDACTLANFSASQGPTVPQYWGMPLEMRRLIASELLSATRLRASRSAVLLVPRHKLALELFLSAGQRYTSILVVERLQLLAALVSASSIRSEGEE